MPTKTKMIEGESFELTWPYEAGHVCTEAEAKALNQVRSENIGNNVRAKVKEHLAKGELQAAKDLVSQKDAEYQFTLASTGGGASRKLDPIEREARAIAREAIKAHLAQTGRKLTTAPEGYTEDEWKARVEEEIDAIAGKEEVLKLAKKRVSEKQKVSESLFASLNEAA